MAVPVPSERSSFRDRSRSFQAPKPRVTVSGSRRRRWEPEDQEIASASQVIVLSSWLAARTRSMSTCACRWRSESSRAESATSTMAAATASPPGRLLSDPSGHPSQDAAAVLPPQKASVRTVVDRIGLGLKPGRRLKPVAGTPFPRRDAPRGACPTEWFLQSPAPGRSGAPEIRLPSAAICSSVRPSVEKPTCSSSCRTVDTPSK